MQIDTESEDGEVQGSSQNEESVDSDAISAWIIYILYSAGKLIVTQFLASPPCLVDCIPASVPSRSGFISAVVSAEQIQTSFCRLSTSRSQRQ